MPKLYLVRHGETLWNFEKRIQGHSDSSLTDLGRTQAKLVGQRLRAVDFDAVYSSDLGRTLETARIITDGLGSEIQIVEALREKHYGNWEQMRVDDARAAFPDDFKRLESDDPDFAPPNGESDNDLVRRVSGFAKHVSGAHADDENILIIGHGGSLRALLVHYMNIPSRGMWNFVLSNGGLSILTTYSAGGALLRLWNDISHIGGESE